MTEGSVSSRFCDSRVVLRLARAPALGVFAFLGIVLLLLGREWLEIWIPRDFPRLAAIGFLVALLGAYVLVLVLSALGAALLGGALAVRLGRGRFRASPARLRAVRGLLLCCVCLAALVGAETTAAGWLAWTHRFPHLPDRFTEPPPGDLTIAVIGGSSSEGVPYQPWVSVGTIVAWELERALPARRARAEILAESGSTLEAMHLKLAHLKRRPDALIVYSGHNEFLTRFPWSRRISYYDDEPRQQRARHALRRAAEYSPLFRLIVETVENRRIAEIPSRPVDPRAGIAGHPICTQQERATIISDFERRLDAIVCYCVRIGCLPILVIPPGNDASDPMRSYATPSTTRQARRALFDRFRQVLAGESSDPAEAEAGYREILAEQPVLSEAHFRLARLMAADGMVAEANRHFVLARDHDGFPMRCTSPIEDAYRAVAQKHAAHAILIDGPAVLRASSPSGILDDHVFHDNVHPNLQGQVALAEAIVVSVKNRRVFGWTESSPIPHLDPVEVAAHFKIDATAWATVCERTAQQYSRISGLRYDSTDHIARLVRYSEAARRIRQGTQPQNVGIPGVGIAAQDSLFD